MSDKKFDIKHLSFMGLLLLVSGIAVYGIVNSSISLGNYTKEVSASVIGAGDSVSATGSTTGSATGSASATTAPVGLIFSDVPVNHETATAISYFKQMGYIGGYEDGSFKPSNLVSRAEFLRILTEMVQADFAGGVYEKCFKDVNSEWFAVYACYASQKKWASGYDDGTFKPAQAVERVEALRMAFVALELKIPTSVDGQPFVDVPVSSWYAPYAKLAKDLGVVNGKVFLPSLKLTRASTVQLLYDVLNRTGKL